MRKLIGCIIAVLLLPGIANATTWDSYLEKHPISQKHLHQPELQTDAITPGFLLLLKRYNGAVQYRIDRRYHQWQKLHKKELAAAYAAAQSSVATGSSSSSTNFTYTGGYPSWGTGWGPYGCYAPQTAALNALITSYSWDDSQALFIANRESGCNPTAKNPNSSATGVFQMIAMWWGGSNSYGWVFNPNDAAQNVYHAYLLYGKQGNSFCPAWCI